MGVEQSGRLPGGGGTDTGFRGTQDLRVRVGKGGEAEMVTGLIV